MNAELKANVKDRKEASNDFTRKPPGESPSFHLGIPVPRAEIGIRAVEKASVHNHKAESRK